MIKKIKIEDCTNCRASSYCNNAWTCDACEDKVIEISEFGETVEIPEWCPLEDYEEKYVDRG
jgi:hypothetical protein